MFDGSREDFTKVSTDIYILAGTSSQACGKMLQCKHFTVLHHRWLGVIFFWGDLGNPIAPVKCWRKWKSPKRLQNYLVPVLS